MGETEETETMAKRGPKPKPPAPPPPKPEPKAEPKAVSMDLEKAMDDEKFQVGVPGNIISFDIATGMQIPKQMAIPSATAVMEVEEKVDPSIVAKMSDNYKEPDPQIIEELVSRHFVPEVQPFTPKTTTVQPVHGTKCPAKMLRHVAELKGRLNAQIAIVIGGGHSAEPYYTELCGKRATFGCSGVPLVCKIRHWYSCDIVRTVPMMKWLDENQDTIKVFCEEAWGMTEVPSTGYKTNTPPPGPITTTERDGLWHGASSAIGACELARHMGARRIFVMGVDYVEVTHPFDKVDPDRGLNRKPWDETRVMNHWRLLRNEYKQLKVELICANPKSLLAVSKLLPVCDQLDALSQCS